jgi:hypothetical protein
MHRSFALKRALNRPSQPTFPTSQGPAETFTLLSPQCFRPFALFGLTQFHAKTTLALALSRVHGTPFFRDKWFVKLFSGLGQLRGGHLPISVADAFFQLRSGERPAEIDRTRRARYGR